MAPSDWLLFRTSSCSLSLPIWILQKKKKNNQHNPKLSTVFVTLLTTRKTHKFQKQRENRLREANPFKERKIVEREGFNFFYLFF